MAIDTAAKRFSIMDFDLPTQPGMEPPDGAVNRSTYLWLYSGIALDGPGGAPEVFITIIGRGPGMALVGRGGLVG